MLIYNPVIKNKRRIISRKILKTSSTWKVFPPLIQQTNQTWSHANYKNIYVYSIDFLLTTIHKKSPAAM